MTNKLPTDYQTFIHLSRYARWNYDEGRRETWNETVTRVINYWRSKYPLDDVAEELKEAILNLEVMPSMRTMMTAGPALDRDNMAGFNCSFLAIDNQRAFDEILYVLTCGTGVGFSVERQYISKLPQVPEELYDSATTIRVKDSRIGWATAYRQLISLLYTGSVPRWDISDVRPAGALLKTFGGRASGPGPLEDLFRFTIQVFRGATGRKLNSIECHDLVCKIGDIVVVGGVRRSALISLSNLSDDRMRRAKNGSWWEDNPQRALANNSVAYTEHPDMESFIKEWLSLVESKSGERGIFNREATTRLQPDRRKALGYTEWGTNPCSEIVLRSAQTCNLSEVIIRPEDNLDSLLRKVRIATILGTLQATLTNFRYVRPIWKKNTEEEALLGVSLTGIMDHSILSSNYYLDGAESWLQEMKEEAIRVNEEWSKRLGINPATAITAVKPSGTVSQLVDSASGIHPRFSKYYIRTVRADKKDPLASFMKDTGFPVEDDVMKPGTGYVFSFPMKAPEDSVTVDQVDALSQLELWKMYQIAYCEHKPSITVYVKEHEWLDVGAWVYKNFDIMSGVSFLPYTGHSYRQAPYQPIDKETYEAWLDRMPTNVDWSGVGKYESEDYTVSSQELACVGNSCEL